MIVVRHLVDWCWQRICMLAVLLMCETVTADVILWGQGGAMPPEINTPYVIKPGESRTQQFFYQDPFEVRSIRLHLNDNPLSSGFGRVTVWLAGESIYSGPAVASITGLSRRLDAGWHPLTVIGIENQSQWVGSASNTVASEFRGQTSPGLNLYISGMSLVPEPGQFGPMLICGTCVGVAWMCSRWLKRVAPV